MRYGPHVDLLVVGGTGYLGLEIIRRAQLAGHHVTATFLTSSPPDDGASWHELDIRCSRDVSALTSRTRPTAVINAAYRQADWATTADGGVHVAVAAADVGARLVHVSSDAVFSGAQSSYVEADLPDPITSYGAAKAAAETAIRATSSSAAITRTSLIVGNGGSAHEKFVHAMASGVAAGVLFTDDVRCPVHVSDLASALLEMASAAHRGILHVAGADAMSRYELAVLIARRDGLDTAALHKGLRSESGVLGPIDVRLDCTRTQAQLSTRLRGAYEFLGGGPSHGPASALAAPRLAR